MEIMKWSPIRRNYDKEREMISLPSYSASIHPLLPSKRPPSVVNGKSAPASSNNSSTGTSRKTVAAMVDPLSSLLLNDPLSAMALGDDPLSAASASAVSTINVEDTHRQNVNASRQAAVEIHQTNLRTPWQLRKEQIISDYTITGSIRLRSNAFADISASVSWPEEDSRPADTYSQRLASLDHLSVLDNTVEMSQKEYQANVAKLSQNLTRSWSNDERVASLKIVTQLASLLGDTSMPQFYPSTFVMVTDELDRFGDLVFIRLKTKSEEILNEGRNAKLKKQRIHLPDNFDATHVPDAVKEICKNWFYKTSCIRELLPRVYVELALLKCHRFLSNDAEYPQTLYRIGSSIRGLGDPLVALYARTYLTVMANEVVPDGGPLACSVSMLRDQLFCFTMVRSPAFISELNRKGIKPSEYSRLLSPGIEWMCKTVGKTKPATSTASTLGSSVSTVSMGSSSPAATAVAGGRETFQSILRQYKDHCNDAMVLKHIIDSFDGSRYAFVAMGLAGLIKEAQISCVSLIDVFTALGKQLAIFPPPEEQRIPLLSEVWKSVGKCDDISSYVKCNAVWLELAQQHCSEREVLILLSDLANKLSEYSMKEKEEAGEHVSVPMHVVVQLKELPESLQPHLASLVESLVTLAAAAAHTTTTSTTQTQIQMQSPSSSSSSSSSSSAREISQWTAVITSDYLPKLLDALTASKRVSICKDILESLRYLPSTTGDAVLINALFNIARIVHDSIDYLTPEGEKRFIATLLCRFIDKVDYGKDLEQQLNVYVESRAIFCNLDTVRDKLVYSVSGLAVKAYRFMKGRHSKKTGAFTKAALAYCYITIASISDVKRRMVLLLHCAQISLLNQCLPQTDAFLKAAITMIPEYPTHDDAHEGRRTHSEEKLAEYVRKLLSTLVVVPGHPAHGSFYMVQGLMNALPKFSWQLTTGVQTRLYIDILGLLCTYAQHRLPYHVSFVDSNDALYCCSSEYMNDLGASVTSCVAEIVRQMTQLGSRTEPLAKISQARCAVDLANKLSVCMSITDNDIGGFVVNLLELADKAKSGFVRTEIRYFADSVEYVKEKIGKDSSLIPRIVALQTPI